MLTLPPNSGGGRHRFGLPAGLLAGPPVLQLARYVAATRPASLAARPHGHLEAAAAANKSRAVAVAVVAVGAGGAALKHRHGAVVLGQAFRVLREEVGDCFHFRERFLVRYPF
jgi:hypothetical protein